MKIHIGCGKRHIPGFVHVDQVQFDHIDHHIDIRDLSCFDDGCAELIYNCHVLEYFDREEIPEVLAEWRRVLAPGGILRLSVPNFDVMSRLYQTGFPLDYFLGTLYGKIPSEDGPIYHRTTFDQPSLTRILETAGFSDVQLWDWRKTEHADTDDFSQAYFPHMDKERGMLWSLNIQGIKI